MDGFCILDAAYHIKNSPYAHKMHKITLNVAANEYNSANHPHISLKPLKPYMNTSVHIPNKINYIKCIKMFRNVLSYIFNEFPILSISGGPPKISLI